jgi:hypothetical protein
LKKTRIVPFIAVAAFMAVVAPSANAGVLVKTADDCGTETIENPFTRWNDHNDYVAVPNGNVENGSDDWSLSGSSVVNGNEPWNVHDSGDSSSLKIPAGKSAVTGTMCVGLEHPTLRFFSKSTSGGGLLGGLVSTLAVEVQFELNTGTVVSLPIGVVLQNGQWQPSPTFVVLANLLPLLPGEHTPVRFKFTAVGGASWQIDDVYVDPRSKL